MVGSHKILTVSYGTFSCTLEGFEDSFETMKAIAEYFRDLAAEDRYFGAEPPQPDAEMLARIAEREIARRVEARMEPSGIVLRVGQALGQSPEQAPAAPVSAPVAAQVMPPSTPADPAPAPAPAESVAAKLQRIRSVVGKGVAAPLPPVSEDAEYDDAPDDTGARIDAAIADAIAAPAAEAEAPAELPVAEAPTAAAPTMDVAGEPAPAATEEPAEALPEEPDVALVADAQPEEAFTEAEEPASKEPVAEKAEPVAEEPVAEVAADVLPAPVEFPDDTAEAEDIPAMDAPAAPLRPRVIRMRKADFDRMVAAGALTAQPELPAAAMPGADLAADLAEADEFDRDAEDAELDDYVDAADLADLARLDAPGPSLSPDEEAELLAELAAVESGMDIDTPPARMATPVPAPALDDDLAATLAAIAAESDAADATMPEKPAVAAPEAEAAENLAGIEDDIAQEIADDTATVAEAAPAPAAQDDDDIMSGVLHAIDADRPVETASAETEPEAEAPESVAAQSPTDEDSDLPAEEPGADDAEDQHAAPARARFAAPEDDEAALERLMSQTDAQMSGPDAARRREAIAQLRAAVAATEAARALGETPSDETDGEGTFREDLRQAVRPRRPVAGQPDLRGERPRPAPLKLVASQRIDLPAAAAPQAPAAIEPIRPRRVTIDRTAEDSPSASPRETSAAMATSGSFTEFAEQMGATSLADLLEAAAAYTAFVEGSEDFSRPQILRKVSMMSPETTREDGLRSFGTLLREGRFRRSPRAGRFEVAEDTRFNPDRHAG